MTFVLVHGAWHGGWCYKKVAARLRAAGHEVYTPTLTGLGERSHLMNRSVNLATHIRDIVNVIRWEELDGVVLCGHSYGGMVITGVADRVPERIRSLVYLDAMVPENGDSFLDRSAEDVAQVLRMDARQKGDGYLVAPITASYFNVNAEDAAWVDRMCVKFPLACFEDKITLSGADAPIGKRTYILATDWPPQATPGPTPPFAAVAERIKGRAGWRLINVPCGHDVMLDRPAELSEMLIAAA